MDLRVKDTLRASATAVGVAAGLLALASTAQTPDGYIHASFGGPLDVFSTSSADVLTIGDGTNDTAELTALLKGPVGPAAKNGAPNSPYRVAYEAGAAPTVTTGSVIVPLMEDDHPITAAPTSKDAAILPSKPVVDSQGKIDCSGAVSCHTDLATNTTTVTYPDGIVAIVQKINDLTVVAYKTITELLPSEISSLLPPPVSKAPPPLLAAVAPSQVPAAPPTAPVVEPEPVIAPPAPETTSGSIDPGPPAPDVDLHTGDGGPRLNVTTPPNDFSPGRGDAGTGTDVQAPKTPALGKVKDTISGVVDAVKGAVGKALGPGAASAKDTPNGSQASDGGSPAPDGAQSSQDSANSHSDKSGGDGSDGS